MNKQELIKEIENNKIIVIIRGLDGEKLEKTVEAMIKGGIKFCEITFSQIGKPTDDEIGNMISHLKNKYLNQIHIGAGTVLNENQVKIAKESGAEYIISPDTNINVIKKTNELGLISIPGAFTPSEITLAYRYGADFVKVFPSDILSPAYFKAIKAPLPNSRLLAVGGININNICSYLNSGAIGCGIGSGIVNKELINKGEYEEISKLATLFTNRIKENSRF